MSVNIFTECVCVSTGTFSLLSVAFFSSFSSFLFIYSTAAINNNFGFFFFFNFLCCFFRVIYDVRWLLMYNVIKRERERKQQRKNKKKKIKFLNRQIAQFLACFEQASECACVCADFFFVCLLLSHSLARWLGLICLSTFGADNSARCCC